MLEHGFHSPRGLPKAPHTRHPVEQRLREARIAKEMVVEKIEMMPGQAIYLRQRAINLHRVELFSSLEESDLVAEVTDVRAAAGDDDRVRHQIEVALDQIPPDRR